MITTLEIHKSLSFKHTIKRIVAHVCLFFTICLASNASVSENMSDAVKDFSFMQSNEEQFFEEIHKSIYDNPSQTRFRINQLIKLLKSYKLNKKQEVKLLKYLGSSYVFETNYSEAINYYNQALIKAEEINLYSEIAHINNNLGVIFNEIGNYKNAYIHLVEALNYYDLADLKEKKIGTLNNIGLIYMNLNNIEKALGCFNDALESTIHPKDTILIVSVLNNIALCYITDNKPDMALGFLDQAIFLSEEVNNQYGLCISYQLMGNLFLSLNNSEKALEAYASSVEIAHLGNLSYQRAVSRLGMAKVFVNQNKFPEAFAVAFDVMELANNQKSLVLQSEAHVLLADIYEKSRDFEKSHYHYKEHIRIQREFINQSVIHQIYDVELNYLNQLNKMQELELDKKELSIRNKSNLLFFLTLTFVLLFSGFYLVYLNYRHRQKVKFQKAIIEFTEKKTKAALEAEIQERKRIGQELHDGLGHLLSLAGLQASVLHKRKDFSEQKRLDLLASLMKCIDDAFGEVRSISHNLAPSLLSEQGLQGALKSISDRVNQSSSLSMSFNTYGLNGKLDSLIENTLFRIIQEIVNNTLKHAQATKLFVQITKGNDEISCIAEDNGKGFCIDDIENQSGYGLMHMKSRVENLNGTFFVDTEKNRGTIISILIPIQAKQ